MFALIVILPSIPVTFSDKVEGAISWGCVTPHYQPRYYLWSCHVSASLLNDSTRRRPSPLSPAGIDNVHGVIGDFPEDGERHESFKYCSRLDPQSWPRLVGQDPLPQVKSIRHPPGS